MTDLDDLFAQARDAGPVPSAALMARVAQDAVMVQAQLAVPAPRAAETPLWDRLLGLFGGGGALAGSMMAGVAGLALGYLQPESLIGLTEILGSDSSYSTAAMDLMPGFDGLLTEE